MLTGHERGVVVLKLGGSVLRGPDALVAATCEVERWLRDGWRVAVVASAFCGRTDTLWHEAALARAAGRMHEVAATLARGECEAVAALSEAFATSGLSVAALTPAEIGIVADAPDPLGAERPRVVGDGVERALARHEVVVVPGFVAQDENARTVLLGRGGSDWTALLLADALRARVSSSHSAVRCRLIKDVDGLYEWDPAGADRARPRRFARVRFDELPDLGDGDRAIVQPHAVAFARGAGLAFEVATWNRDEATVVGADTTAFLLLARPRRLRIGVCGCGTVGAEVVRGLLELEAAVGGIVSVLVRDLGKVRAVERELPWTDDLDAFFTADPELVVELVGDGEGVGEAIVDRALAEGRHVVSANKALLASRRDEFVARASAAGTGLEFGAAVGGGAPMLENVRRARGRCEPVVALRGVLNGTTNHVLDSLCSGRSLSAAVDEARARGLCEFDLATDLEGRDAAAKLGLLVAELADPDAPCTHIECGGWNEPGPGDGVVRQVASWSVGRPGRVALEILDPADPLYDVCGTDNRLVVRFADGVEWLVDGVGAGAQPTARAVLADVLAVVRRGVSTTGRRPEEVLS